MNNLYEVKSRAGFWGDQGDGTYINPILPGDFSDPDVIRVKDEYYCIASTFQYSPGMIVLKSMDLVNWEIIGHVVDDITQIGPELNYDRMARYNAGIWAGSIRYYKDKFYVYFFTPDEGLFMSTAEKAEGPWTPLHKIWEVSGWDDCCPFWDDDGKAYLVATNFSDNYNIHLFRMSEDGRELFMDSDKIIHQHRGSEANKLYKINGLYYFFHSEVRVENGAAVRVVFMLRSKNIYGPYEEKELIHTHGQKYDREPNQGALVQTASGDWYFITHHGCGKASYEGRPISLLPVKWVDGWPIIGEDIDDDGIGEMVWGGAKPISGYEKKGIQASDDFSSPKLKHQWEWNYQPRADKWSLTERPGFLRLYACVPLEQGNLFKACNTITQRVWRKVNNEATVKMDITGMEENQEAGLCHYGKSFCTIGVVQENGIRRLKYNDNGNVTFGPQVSGENIWLKSVWTLEGINQYQYSLDGITFTGLGGEFKLHWGHYRGDRIGIYCYNNKQEKGYVDIDWFEYR